MVNQKKIESVKKLKEKLKEAKSLFFVDYSGLSVSQQEKLRNEVKKAGGEFTVAKNTLFKLAAENSRYQLKHQLTGPTAILLSFEDEIKPIKALVKFSKEFEIPKVKFGFFEGKLVEKEAVLELAQIPAKKELLSQLVFTLDSPISGLANILQGNIRKLILIVKSIRPN